MTALTVGRTTLNLKRRSARFSAVNVKSGCTRYVRNAVECATRMVKVQKERSFENM